MTIQQITEKLQKKVNNNTKSERLQFATIVNKASVTEINLDGSLKDVISIKWYTLILTFRIKQYNKKNQ